MPENRTLYSYESKDNRFFFWSKRYGSREIDADLLKMNADLPIASRVEKPELENYLNTVHRNIFWYLINRKKQEKLYYLYMALTLALAALIPYSCYKIAFLAKEAGVTSGVVTAQLTTILTGGVAFHRVITSWLFRRNTALEFWRAGSALKKLHLNLIERWKKDSQPPDDPYLFSTDLTVTAKKARAIINIETEAHFASFSGIEVDLGQVLTSAAATSKILLDDFGGQIIAEMKKAENRQQERQKLARSEQLKLIELRVEIKGLGRQLGKLSVHQEFIADREQLKVMREKVQSIKSRLTDKEVAAARTEARFAALRSAV